MCAIKSYYPKVGMGQLFKRYLEYFSSYKYFSKTEEGVCAVKRPNPKAGLGRYYFK